MQTLSILGKNLSPENPGLPILDISCVTRAPPLLLSCESYIYTRKVSLTTLLLPEKLDTREYPPL